MSQIITPICHSLRAERAISANRSIPPGQETGERCWQGDISPSASNSGRLRTRAQLAPRQAGGPRYRNTSASQWLYDGALGCRSSLSSPLGFGPFRAAFYGRLCGVGLLAYRGGQSPPTSSVSSTFESSERMNFSVFASGPRHDTAEKVSWSTCVVAQTDLRSASNPKACATEHSRPHST